MYWSLWNAISNSFRYLLPLLQKVLGTNNFQLSSSPGTVIDPKLKSLRWARKCKVLTEKYWLRLDWRFNVNRWWESESDGIRISALDFGSERKKNSYVVVRKVAEQSCKTGKEHEEEKDSSQYQNSSKYWRRCNLHHSWKTVMALEKEEHKFLSSDKKC